MNKNTEKKVVCCLIDLYDAFTNPELMESAKQKYKDNNLVLEILNTDELERLNKIKELKNGKI
jgi:hypothetical protein